MKLKFRLLNIVCITVLALGFGFLFKTDEVSAKAGTTDYRLFDQEDSRFSADKTGANGKCTCFVISYYKLFTRAAGAPAEWASPEGYIKYLKEGIKNGGISGGCGAVHRPLAELGTKIIGKKVTTNQSAYSTNTSSDSSEFKSWVKQELNNGKFLIFNSGGGNGGGHYMPIWGVDDSKGVQVADSYDPNLKYLSGANKKPVTYIVSISVSGVKFNDTDGGPGAGTGSTTPLTQEEKKAADEFSINGMKELKLDDPEFLESLRVKQKASTAENLTTAEKQVLGDIQDERDVIGKFDLSIFLRTVLMFIGLLMMLYLMFFDLFYAISKATGYRKLFESYTFKRYTVAYDSSFRDGMNEKNIVKRSGKSGLVPLAWGHVLVFNITFIILATLILSGALFWLVGNGLGLIDGLM